MNGGKRAGDGGKRERNGDRPERFADLVDEDTVPLADRDRGRAPPSVPPPPARSGDLRPDVPHFQLEFDGHGGRADGVSRNDFAKLQLGELPVDREVDLHGLTAVEAKGALDACLEQALRAEERCVIAIHGRGLHSPGDPVLRAALPSWLMRGRFAAKVLAFAPAPQKLGGSGATLVWLRRQR